MLNLCSMIVATALVLGELVSAGNAQGYPSRPVSVIVPYAPGGATDVIARITAQGLTEELGQSFVVENRGGGGGMIGVEAGARSAPDGHTLLFASTGPATISPVLFKARAFDPLARLEPIVQVASSPAVLLVRKSLPVGSVVELVEASRSTPGGLNMASAGKGSLQHLVGEYFQAKTKVRWTHVPFRGTAPAFSELIAERVDVMVDVVPAAAPLVRAGQVRALAVMAPRRSSQLPELATLEELGFPGFDFSGWHALFAPKGVSAEVTARLNGSVNKILQTPAVRSQLEKIGARPDGGASTALAERMRVELKAWSELIEALGITPEAN